MTRDELITKVSEQAKITKKNAGITLATIIESVMETLANGDSVNLVGFGTFKTTKRSARKCINPQTKKEMTVPEKTVPVFKPGKKLKEAVE